MHDWVRHHLVADVPVARLPVGRHRFRRAARHHGRARRARYAGRHAVLRRVQGRPARRGAARRRGGAARYGARHVVRTRRPRRVRARPAGDPRRDGPADHRRHQHLVRRQGGARGGHQGRAERAGRRRTASAAIRRSTTCRAACTCCGRSASSPASAGWCAGCCRRPSPRAPAASRSRPACCSTAATGRAPICCAAASSCRGSSTSCSIRRWCEEGLRRLAPLSHIAAELQPGRPLGDFDRVAALETSLYMRNQLLRDADWAGMAHSIEIRVPYVDPFFLAALPPGDVLAAIKAKEAVADVPQPPLPDVSRNRAKTGFVTPVGRWMREASGAGRGRRLLQCLARLGVARLAGRLDRLGSGLTAMTARMLALVSDCYGMGGGIARYNQDLFEGLAEGGAEIVVLPRHGDVTGVALPKGIRQEPAIFSRFRYPLSALWLAWRKGPFDVVFCGHAYMAPIAWAVARLSARATGCRRMARRSGRRGPIGCGAPIEAADLVTTVSRGTRHSLLGWVDLPPDRVRVLPDTVQDKFVPGPSCRKASASAGRSGQGRSCSPSDASRPASATRATSRCSRCCRSCASSSRRWSISWPAAATTAPTWSSGRASWRARMPCASWASCRRTTCSTSIAWPISTSCRAPQEGFGIVYLEAAGCGLRVVGGVGGGSADAVPNDKVGVLVDPSDKAALLAAIVDQLGRGTRRSCGGRALPPHPFRRGRPPAAGPARCARPIDPDGPQRLHRQPRQPRRQSAHPQGSRRAARGWLRRDRRGVGLLDRSTRLRRRDRPSRAVEGRARATLVQRTLCQRRRTLRRPGDRRIGPGVPRRRSRRAPMAARSDRCSRPLPPCEPTSISAITLPACVPPASPRGSIRRGWASMPRTSIPGEERDDLRSEIVRVSSCAWLPRCPHFTAAAPLIGEAYATRYDLAQPTTVLNVFPLTWRPRNRSRRAGRCAPAGLLVLADDRARPWSSAVPAGHGQGEGERRAGAARRRPLGRTGAAARDGEGSRHWRSRAAAADGRAGGDGAARRGLRSRPVAGDRRQREPPALPHQQDLHLPAGGHAGA